MGLVLDVYWYFSEIGYYYLGRVLASLDPNEPELSILPPHFSMEGDPMINQDIAEAMKLMYSPIMKKRCGIDKDPISVSLKCLASVIYNSKWLEEFGKKYWSSIFIHLIIESA